MPGRQGTRNTHRDIRSGPFAKMNPKKQEKYKHPHPTKRVKKSPQGFLGRGWGLAPVWNQRKQIFLGTLMYSKGMWPFHVTDVCYFPIRSGGKPRALTVISQSKLICILEVFFQLVKSKELILTSLSLLNPTMFVYHTSRSHMLHHIRNYYRLHTVYICLLWVHIHHTNDI